MDTEPLEDPASIVAAMLRRDPAGLDGAYRRYAEPLHAYSRSLLHDPEAAADVVHETFLLASARIGQLREPDRLRPWLYAIARHECHRVQRQRRRSAPVAEPPELPADAPEPGAALRAAQARELVDAAATGLAPTDREVIALALRHELAAAEVAQVLGVSSKHAHALLSRARAQLHRSLGALLLARGGAAHCPALARLLSDWDGRLTPLLRKRLARHADDCPQCTGRRRALLTPDAVLPASALLPLLAGASAVRLRPRRGLLVGTAVAAVAVLFLVLARAQPPPRVASGWAAPAATPPAVSVSLSPSPVPTAAQARHTTAPPIVAPPTASPSTVETFAVAVGTFRLVCQGSTYALAVRVNATGGALASAKLYWRSAGNGGGLTAPPLSKDMTPNGQQATVAVSPLAMAAVSWWVRATAADGRTAQTPARTSVRPC